MSKYSPIDEEDCDTGVHKPQLHMACFVGDTEVVKILLEKGAKINKLDANGQNCLDIAIAQKHSDVIKALLTNEKWKSLITEAND